MNNELQNDMLNNAANGTMITANRSADEPFRLERLSRVATRVTEQLRLRLVHLHEHKGLLGAVIKQPTEQDVQEIVRSWGAENETIVEIYDEFKMPVWSNT